MMGLPSSMIRSVIDKGMTAEMFTLNKILHMAKRVEEGTKVIQQYDDRHWARVTNPSHPIHVTQPSCPSPTSSWPVQSTRSMPTPAGHLKSQALEQWAPVHNSQPPDWKWSNQSSTNCPGNSSSHRPQQLILRLEELKCLVIGINMDTISNELVLPLEQHLKYCNHLLFKDTIVSLHVCELT